MIIERVKPLLPDRHPQRELFVCDVADVVFKDDIGSMEHPVFALATQRDTNIRCYEHGNVKLEVIPSGLGHATIFDKDILIYAVSHLMAAKNAGAQISQTINMSARDLLVVTNRNTGGRDYKELENAMTRLSGTRLRTNIETDKEGETNIFGIVESAMIKYHPQTGRATGLHIKLSDWYYRAILGNEVLTLHPDYFRLRKPIERRIYELARKHCGSQQSWQVLSATLLKKTGSTGSEAKFREALREIARHNHLPDYTIELDENAYKVTFRSRKLAVSHTDMPITAYGFKAETFEDARNALNGWDVQHVFEAWIAWFKENGMEAPRSADAAFVGFCCKWYEKRGAPR